MQRRLFDLGAETKKLQKYFPIKTTDLFKNIVINIFNNIFKDIFQLKQEIFS